MTQESDVGMEWLACKDQISSWRQVFLQHTFWQGFSSFFTWMIERSWMTFSSCTYSIWTACEVLDVGFAGKESKYEGLTKWKVTTSDKVASWLVQLVCLGEDSYSSQTWVWFYEVLGTKWATWCSSWAEAEKGTSSPRNLKVINIELWMHWELGGILNGGFQEGKFEHRSVVLLSVPKSL